MCGIVGFIGKGSRDDVSAMVGKIAHSGLEEILL